VGILASSGQILLSGLDKCVFAGELSMDGSLCKTQGILNITEAAEKRGLEIFVPESNVREAGLIEDALIRGVPDLHRLTEHLNMKRSAPIYKQSEGFDDPYSELPNKIHSEDFLDVKGQEAAKRALVIAAAGGHGVLMIGGPSSGKTMLAERMPGIMPDMSHDEIVKTTEIYSAAGLLTEDMPYVRERPFRKPHHTVTRAGLIGGGSVPKPGEITLANNGILFLDEFAEIDPNVMNALREPLEQKQVVITRNSETFLFPSDFLLIAAANPCRCGYYGDPDHECTCTPGDISRYRSKLSGPVMERIDIHLELKSVMYDDLEQGEGLSTAEMRKMVIKARNTQKERFEGYGIVLNSQMTDRMIAEMTDIEYEGRVLLRDAYGKLKLDPRSLGRTIKVARTIADIEGNTIVSSAEIGEALQYSRWAE